MRQRTDGTLDADDVVDWARVQVGSWWAIAAAFAPQASVREIDDSGRPVVVGGPLPATCCSNHPLGDIWAVDHAPVANVSRCEATYLYSVTATGQLAVASTWRGPIRRSAWRPLRPVSPPEVS